MPSATAPPATAPPATAPSGASGAAPSGAASPAADVPVISALAAEVLDAVRAGGGDALGAPPVELTATGGEPLRCCLTDAPAGDALVLFGYAPDLPGAGSPYQEVGAVFAHASPCAGWLPSPGYPPAWSARPQVVRGYDRRGWIHVAVVHDGGDPMAAIRTVLDDPAVVVAHSRNIAHGCFMFAAHRPGTGQ